MRPTGPPIYCFCHVAKTGGHTFAATIRDSYPAHEVCLKAPLGSELNEVDKERTVWVCGESVQIGQQYGNGRTHRWVTLIRDPVDRVISWHYAKRNARQSKGLPVYSMDQSIMLSRNKMAKKLAYLHDYWLIGRTDRFEQFLLALEERLGKKLARVLPLNVNRVRPGLDEVSPETLASIERANDLDMELWNNWKNRCP